MATLALYPMAGSPWAASPAVERLAPRAVLPISDPALLREPLLSPSLADQEAALASTPAAELTVTARAAGHGLAPIGSLDLDSRTNILIAIEFLDGYVIEPGARLSFDDVARTWDFREDPRYVWGWGTSAYGLVRMRGGGACWVATALWRSALAAGLRTDYRQNHFGLVPLLGAGSDATNTLIVRNNSAVPITVRAWMDEDDVNVALFPDGDLDRMGQIRGPDRLGPGRYALYQDVTWDDGTRTTSPFYSGYYW